MKPISWAGFEHKKHKVYVVAPLGGLYVSGEEHGAYCGAKNGELVRRGFPANESTCRTSEMQVARIKRRVVPESVRH